MMEERSVSPPPCVFTAKLIVFRPLRPTGHEGDVRFSMKEMCSFISFERRRAFRRRRDDRGRFEIHRETTRLALLRKTRRLALLRETRRLALLRETRRLALLAHSRPGTARLSRRPAADARRAHSVPASGAPARRRTAAAPACVLRRRRRVDCGGAGVYAPMRTAAAPACSVAARAQPLSRPGRL